MTRLADSRGVSRYLKQDDARQALFADLQNPSQIVIGSVQLLDISKKTNTTWGSARWRN